MIENLPAFITSLFALTTLLTLGLFLQAAPNYKPVLLISIIWLGLQGFLGYSGFYTITSTIPPRFLLLPFPPLLIILFLFLTSKGRSYIDDFDAQWLTWLHVVRIPVEMALFWLFMNRQVPQLMTFEGRNFDILSGITAPFIAWFGYSRDSLSKTVILIWNFICLGLLINIVANAVLSLPAPFQQFGFEQPDKALLYFPFIWLPCFIVPVVLFSHLVSIRQVLKSRN